MRKLLMVLAIMAMVVFAGACGASENGGSSAKNPAEKGAPAKAERPTPVETVQVAYRETAAESTARTSFEVTAGQLAGPEASGRTDPVTMTGQGVVDFSGVASSMTVSMTGMGGLEMRQIEDTGYVKMPEDLVGQMPGAKPWLEVDLNAVSKQQYGANLGEMQSDIAQDPAGPLEYLRGVSESVEKVGTEQVRGTRTTRYRATIDLREATAQEGPEAREAYDEAIETLGSSKLPVEVWLDDQNRVRRYAMDLTVPMPENAASPNASREDATMRTQTVVEYYDFGVPVDVQAPPPDQTTDGSKLLAGGQPVAR